MTSLIVVALCLVCFVCGLLTGCAIGTTCGPDE